MDGFSFGYVQRSRLGNGAVNVSKDWRTGRIVEIEVLLSVKNRWCYIISMTPSEDSLTELTSMHNAH